MFTWNTHFPNNLLLIQLSLSLSRKRIKSPNMWWYFYKILLPDKFLCTHKHLTLKNTYKSPSLFITPENRTDFFTPCSCPFDNILIYLFYCYLVNRKIPGPLCTAYEWRITGLLSFMDCVRCILNIRTYTRVTFIPSYNETFVWCVSRYSFIYMLKREDKHMCH